MKKVKLNGKEVTKKEVDKFLEDKNTKVTSVSISQKREEDAEVPAPSHEGIDFSKEYFSLLSQKMTKANASRAITTFTQVPGMMNRNVIVIIAEPDDEINDIIAKA